eukprot:12081652-Alexandrium_andersonii.AAC.1
MHLVCRPQVVDWKRHGQVASGFIPMEGWIARSSEADRTIEVRSDRVFCVRFGPGVRARRDPGAAHLP